MPTIRYYEQIGLLPTPARSDANRRRYGASDVRRLGFIRHARELGFEIDAIRTLIALQDDPNRPCAAADALARSHLRQTERRIAGLEALKVELERMLSDCVHGRVAECRVIEVLADHGECSGASHSHGDAGEEPHAAPSVTCGAGVRRSSAPAKAAGGKRRKHGR